MQLSELEVLSKISSGHSSMGGQCKFIDLGNGFGLKMYEKDDTRLGVPFGIVSYYAQKYAASFGLGPEVGQIFQLDVGGGTYIVFVTEVVQTMADYTIDFECTQESKLDPHGELREQMHTDFVNVLKSYYGDAHYGNLGFKNGKCIVIDFDRCVDLALRQMKIDGIDVSVYGY